ncbi:MAG: hypothetical protein JJU33_03150 [Phycisphaerales bacterium]|nr:hypothetical protein [Phycisphaerales bacterium]
MNPTPTSDHPRKPRLPRLLAAVLLTLSIFPAHASAIASTSPPAVVSWTDPDCDLVLVVAHRATIHLAPENSLRAIELSILYGADIVEVDLRRTSDGHYILMHDTTVDRTTNGRGKVSELALEDISALRLLSPDGPVTDQPVPTLEEALELVRGRAMINLDKVSPEQMAEVVEIVAQMDLLDHALFKSREQPEQAAKRLSALPPEVRYMPIITASRIADEDLIELIERYHELTGATAVELIFNQSNADRMTHELFSRINDIGVRVWINTLWDGRLSGGLGDDSVGVAEPERLWGQLIEAGVGAIQTDYPIHLRSLLASQGFARAARKAEASED